MQLGPSHASVRTEDRNITDRARQPARVFISYRRTEVPFAASWLHKTLSEYFSETEIFEDVKSIDLGDDFVTSIISAVESCDVLLAVIGSSWLMLADGEGNRRIDDPDDFVRIEIETALRRGIRVIPILIDAAMPTAEQLPPSLARLARKQALELTAGRFMQDAMLLIKVIEKDITESQARKLAQSGSTPSQTHDTAYCQAISRKNPGCIIVLLDRSESMGQLWNAKETLAQRAARAINGMLLELCLRGHSQEELSRHYFDIGIFGYGKRPIAGGEGVESGFRGALAGRALVPLPDVRNNPTGIREVVSPEHGSSTIRTPIWVEPAHGYGRPMCQAIAVAGQHAFEWTQAHPASFPPIIINITDGWGCIFLRGASLL